MYCFALKSVWTSKQASECACVVDGVHHGDQHIPYIYIYTCTVFLQDSPLLLSPASGM